MKHKLKTLSLADKINVIAYTSQNRGTTKSDVAKHFSIPLSMLHCILSKQDSLQQKYESSSSSAAIKRVKSFKNSDIDPVMYMWFAQARHDNMIVSGLILLEKAKSFDREMGSNIEVNQSWINRWKMRHGVHCGIVCGESASIDLNTVASWKESPLQHILRNYEPDNIYNADERVKRLMVRNNPRTASLFLW